MANANRPTAVMIRLYLLILFSPGTYKGILALGALLRTERRPRFRPSMHYRCSQPQPDHLRQNMN